MARSGRAVRSLWLAGLLAAGTGCSKKEEAPPPPAEAAAPREGTAEAHPPVHPVLSPDAGATATAETAPPAPPPGSDEAAPPAAQAEKDEPPAAQAAKDAAAPDTAALAPEDPKNREWTAGVMDLKRRVPRPVTLTSVRTGKHDGFDRVVFEFEGAQLPGYRLEYVDTAVQCGSGDEVKLAGQGQLQVTFTPARAHTDQGQSTLASLKLKPALTVIQELERTCDFEGEVTWVLGNAHPNTYRVMELREPTRLVVDVRH